MTIETPAATSDRAFKVNALQIAKGATWFSLATVAGMILEYATQGMVAAHLGPAGFGIVSVALQIFSVALVFASLALPNAVIYFLPSLQRRNDVRGTSAMIATSFWTSLLTGLAVCGVLVIMAKPLATYGFKEPRLAEVLQLLALAVPGSALVLLMAGILRGLKMTWQASLLVQFYERACRFLCLLVLFWAGFGLRAPALAYVPTSLLICVIGLFYLRRSLKPAALVRPSIEAFQRLRQYSGPLFLSQILARGRTAIQPLILAYFLNAHAVGLYAAALLFIHAFSMVLLAFNFFYVPVISEVSDEGDMSRVQRLYRLVTRWSLIFVLPTCLLVILWPEMFLSLLGGQYLEGSLVLRITIIGVIVNIGVGTVGTTLLATGHTRAYLLTDTFGTGTSLLLGLLLIPRFGLIGAAVAQMLTVVLGNAYTLLTVYRLHRMQPFSRDYLAIFLTAFGSVAVFYPLIHVAGGASPWLVMGMIPIMTGLMVGILLKFRLLDADSCAVADESWRQFRKRLAAVPSRFPHILP